MERFMIYCADMLPSDAQWTVVNKHNNYILYNIITFVQIISLSTNIFLNPMYLNPFKIPHNYRVGIGWEILFTYVNNNLVYLH